MQWRLSVTFHVSDFLAKCATVEAAPVAPAAASRGSRHNEVSVQDHEGEVQPCQQQQPFREQPITSYPQLLDSKVPILIKNSSQHAT